MKNYEQYLQTTNYWYPKLPLNWKVCKVKYIAETISGGTPSTQISEYWEKGDIPWLPSGKLQNCEITTAEKFISEEGFNNSSTKWIKPNTVLVALTGATCSNIGYLTFRACANQSVIAINENKNITNSRFLFYMFLEMRSQILTHQTGGAQAGINDSNVKNLFLMLPPIQEQSQIARYLDHQTSLIDEIINRKEKQIELLKEKRQAIINEIVTKGLNPDAKMKDSGIEWLGEIPEHWTKSKLKFVSKVKGRIGFRGYTTDDLVIEGEGALTLGATHINQEGELDLSNPVFISWDKFEESPEIMLEVGDILIVQRGSTCGKVGLIVNDIGKATINPSLVILKDIKVIGHYLFYLIQSSIDVLVNLTRSSSIPMLSQEQIGNLDICLPPFQEQKKIIEKLITVKSKYSQLIISLNVQIEKLKEYRQSIISETVTGKIDLRDWQPNNA